MTLVHDLRGNSSDGMTLSTHFMRLIQKQGGGAQETARIVAEPRAGNRIRRNDRRPRVQRVPLVAVWSHGRVPAAMLD